jgi:two-component system, response regulator PdtaR
LEPESQELFVDQAQTRLLLCDDDRLVLATLAEGLRLAGYSVVEADNGDDAILLGRKHKPDLALLDIRMNGKDGLDVARYLRDHVGTPCVFLTACSDDEVVRHAIAVGALDFIVKPVSVRNLLPWIEAALARARLRAADAANDAVPTVFDRNFLQRRAMAIAIGILMERYGVNAGQASQRLQQWASERGRSIDAAALEVASQAEVMGSLSDRS